MNSCPYPCNKGLIIRSAVSEAGAIACGIAKAAAVSGSDNEILARWLADGCHARMDYMERNGNLRCDPRQLMPGCQSVIAAAFNYRSPHPSPIIAEYALGSDYHFVLRERLNLAAEKITAELGGECRIAIDSAPLRERYWAAKAGIGFLADNGMLCVPGYGMTVLLGFILWSGECDSYDEPLTAGCLHCGRCVRACPGKALSPAGRVDARRCLSYLTIEHRGDFPPDMPPMPLVYGCDCCRKVCPLDHGPLSNIEEFQPSPELLSLTANELTTIASGQFRRLFGSSPIFRIRPSGLRRNAGYFTR